MGVPMHFDEFVDGDVIRQHFIQPENWVELEVFRYLDVAVILAGMDPGIRSPTTDAIDFVAEHLFQGILQCFLHTGMFGLPLPTVVMSAFVGKMEEEFHGAKINEVRR